MSPKLYTQLCCVEGFIKLNGKSYNEHITIIFKDILNNEQKKNILKCKKDVLKLLTKYKIKFSHNVKYH